MFLPGKNGKGQTWELVLKYLNNFKNLSVLITEWVNQFFFHEGYQMIQFFLSLPVYMYKMIYAVYFKIYFQQVLHLSQQLIIQLSVRFLGEIFVCSII